MRVLVDILHHALGLIFNLDIIFVLKVFLIMEIKQSKINNLLSN